MKRPERKTKHEFTPAIPYYDVGYNQACDDYEKYLPSEEQLLVLMLNKIPPAYHNNPDKISEFGDVFEDIAKSLSKRIGGK